MGREDLLLQPGVRLRPQGARRALHPHRQPAHQLLLPLFRLRARAVAFVVRRRRRRRRRVHPAGGPPLRRHRLRAQLHLLSGRLQVRQKLLRNDRSSSLNRTSSFRLFKRWRVDEKDLSVEAIFAEFPTLRPPLEDGGEEEDLRPFSLKIRHNGENI